MQEIRQILRNYPTDCQPTSCQSLASAGGMSGAKFWRLSTQRGELVLRRWPQEQPTPERLTFIHRTITRASQNGCTLLAVPLAARDGTTWILHAGHLWELAPWLPGTASYTSAPNEAKLAGAMRALAKFHLAAIDIGHTRQPAIGAAPAIIQRAARIEQLTRGELAQLSRAIDARHWPQLVPLARTFVELAPRLLPAHRSKLAALVAQQFPLQPCLRDVWHDHVLFVGDEVSGLIDYGAIDIDTPATDVARLLGSLVEDEAQGWQLGLAAYHAVRPLTEIEERAARALDTVGPLVAGCNWMRWIYLDRRTFENRDQVVERFQRIVQRCERQASGLALP